MLAFDKQEIELIVSVLEKSEDDEVNSIATELSTFIAEENSDSYVLAPTDDDEGLLNF